MSDSFLVEFKCPKKLVDDFDETVERVGYASRSEALRRFMRDLVEENRKKET